MVEVLGWDEAFVGIETDDPETYAREAQAAVRAATRLSCAVGIGDTKVRAKIATEFGKPGGIFRLTGGELVRGDGGAADGRALGRWQADLGPARRIWASRRYATWPGPTRMRLINAFGPQTGPYLRRSGVGSAARWSTTRPGWPGRTATRRPTSATWSDPGGDRGAPSRTWPSRWSRTCTVSSGRAPGSTSRCGSRRSSPTPGSASCPSRPTSLR